MVRQSLIWRGLSQPRKPWSIGEQSALLGMDAAARPHSPLPPPSRETQRARQGRARSTSVAAERVQAGSASGVPAWATPTHPAEAGEGRAEEQGGTGRVEQTQRYIVRRSHLACL